MNIKEKSGFGIMGLAFAIQSVLGLVIHVWTVVIAYLTSGLFAAVLTLIFPVISEIYWFFKVGSNLGFGVYYCVAIMAYILLWVVAFVGLKIASSGNSFSLKKNSRNRSSPIRRSTMSPSIIRGCRI